MYNLNIGVYKKKYTTALKHVVYVYLHIVQFMMRFPAVVVYVSESVYVWYISIKKIFPKITHVKIYDITKLVFCIAAALRRYKFKTVITLHFN